jgi:hypothetical protein
MRGKIFLLLLFLFLVIPAISASCNSTQVDINSASLKNLDKIIHIGPSMAQKIADSRPFYSVDDLANVRGIGNGSNFLDIKRQNLACVSDEMDIIYQETLPNISSTVEDIIPISQTEQITKEPTRQENLTMINLGFSNSQNIKTQNGNEGNKNYAIYGLVGFCILLTGLYFIKIRKRKNEFR